MAHADLADLGGDGDGIERTFQLALRGRVFAVISFGVTALAAPWFMIAAVQTGPGKCSPVLTVRCARQQSGTASPWRTRSMPAEPSALIGPSVKPRQPSAMTSGPGSPPVMRVARRSR